MNNRIRLIPRIALFAAVIYVLSLGTYYLPNVNLIFFIIYISAMMWQLVPGILVGIIGMALWTFFNPGGPAPLPIMIAQIIGASLSAVVGFFDYKRKFLTRNSKEIGFYLIISGAVCSLLYFGLVNYVDAMLFQPFRERFIIGTLWSLSSIVSNMIIFPLLFLIIRPFIVKERDLLWADI